jgi:hypothetical protein
MEYMFINIFLSDIPWIGIVAMLKSKKKQDNNTEQENASLRAREIEYFTITSLTHFL